MAHSLRIIARETHQPPTHPPPSLFPLVPPPAVVPASFRPRLLVVVSVGLAFALGPNLASAQFLRSAPPDVQQQVRRSLHGDDLQGKDGPLSTIGARLATLYYQHQARGTAGVKRLAQTKARQTTRTRYGATVSKDGQLVTINAIAATSTSHLRTDLRRLGLKNSATAGNVVSGRLPISALKAAAGLSSLRGLLPATYRMHVGSVGSEADTAHAAYKGRQDLGVNGSGLKICALSDSYDQDGSASTTATNDVDSGDLPSDVDVLDDSFTSGTDEGRAMLQLIHDIAPSADLGFHTASGGLAGFVNGIRALADPNRGNCDIIVDDIGYNTEPFYQDGPVSNVADSVVSEGIPYFSSAGNDGQNAYTAPFRDSGNPGVISPGTAVAHDFDPGAAVDTLQEITIPQDGDFGFFTFQWTDPSALVTGSDGADTDLDVALVNDTLGTVASSSRNSDQDGNGIPFESLRYTNNGNVDADEDGSPDTKFHLVVEKYSGPDPDSVKYIYFGSGYTIVDDYGDTGTATIYGHPMAEKAMAVAAAPYFNTQNEYSCGDCPRLESFSSKGGIPILFDQTGNDVSPPIVRQKPDATAVDGVNNTFFGSGDYEGDGNPNFFGTSAAAPNVAAIAALILEANPGYSPAELYTHLETNATDVTTRTREGGGTESIAGGVDPWSGHGFVQAAASALPVELAQFNARAEDETAVLTWKTASETNNAGFAVEHKYEDGAFKELTFKEGAGTTDDATRYRYRTASLEVGTHTFRLRQVDLDGSTTYSDSVSVDVALAGTHSVSPVSPNPLHGPGTVSVTVRRPQPVTAAVYNVLGQQVARLHDGLLPAQTPTTLRVGSDLSSGVYFLRVEGESFATTRKFVRLQ